jgi:2,4-dienoyl-CoA reductase-like NADH-dependent reductase (Old Yellow Enzyme family)
VIRAVRDTIGDRYPLLLKLNSDDYLPGGFSADAMLGAAALFADEGIYCIELSGGTESSPVRFWPIRPGRIRPGHEGYYRYAVRQLKETLPLPLAQVGGIRSWEAAEGFTSTGTADLIALSRPLIRDPRLVNRWKSGDIRPSACLSCDCCFRRVLEGWGLACEIEERWLS